LHTQVRALPEPLQVASVLQPPLFDAQLMVLWQVPLTHANPVPQLPQSEAPEPQRESFCSATLTQVLPSQHPPEHELTLHELIGTQRPLVQVSALAQGTLDST